MDLSYTYSSKGKDYDIEILVDFRCTYKGSSQTFHEPTEGPEFEINKIFYASEDQRLSLEEEKALEQFLSEDQDFYDRMCERQAGDELYSYEE